MTKIAYNGCYCVGGFSLSRAAIMRAREISGNPLWGGVAIKGDVYSNGSRCNHDYGYISDVSRADIALIQTIEELGKRANGMCTDLRIAEVPAGTAYRIDEHDGLESVMTSSDYTWEIA